MYKTEQVIPEEWRSQFIAESDGFFVLMVVDFSPHCDDGTAGVIVPVCLLGFLALAPNIVELLLVFSCILYVIKAVSTLLRQITDHAFNLCIALILGSYRACSASTMA